MPSITQKLRNVFSWQHDTYKVESNETERSSENLQNNDSQTSTTPSNKGTLFKPKTIQSIKTPRGAVSKISKDRQKLNQILVTRNPSVTSAQLNAAVPLVNIRRVASNKSILSEIQTESRIKSAGQSRAISLSSNVTIRNKTNNTKRAATTSKPESSTALKAIGQQRGLFSSNRALPKIPHAASARPTSGGSTKHFSNKSSQQIIRKAPPVPSLSTIDSSKNSRGKENNRTKSRLIADDEPLYATISRHTTTSIRRQPVLSTFGKAR